MQKNRIWGFAEEALTNKKNICLIVMVDMQGSGPNRPGAKLIIDSTGNRAGTVGGGNAEVSLVNKAEIMLSDNSIETTQVITMNHKPSGDNSSGMICSGTQIFLLILITQNELPVIKAIADAEINYIPSTITITPAGLALTTDIEQNRHIWISNNKSWCYTEIIGECDTVYLIGGGHVALALTKILAMLDFRIIVLDNRKELDTMKANKLADECNVVDYSNILQYIPSGNHSYVCIMTYGHKHDELILEQLVEYPLAYLGMMGSDAKIEQIKTNLINRGISSAELDTVHTPIGIPIESNTPAEIAVSIAAELISICNI